MSIRVVIVDDEELARRGVRTRLEKLDDVDIVAECKNGREAVECIRRDSPDLVFLDVQMPGKSGFDVIESIGAHSFPYVIFLTAHDKYATRAFDVRALDYLLKPIDDERFHIALSRARDSLSRDREHDLSNRLSRLVNDIRTASRPSPPTASGGDHRIMVRSGGRVMFVKVEEIDWVEAAGDYVSIHSGKKSWLLRETISALEKRLTPYGFARIHRSTIVQLRRVSELRTLDNGEYLVLLADGTQLRLSRNYRQALEPLIGTR
jgi:two-component system, LytTR family, response regulator